MIVILATAVGYYLFSTPRSSDLVMVGTVDANQVIVSSKLAGIVEKLLVDEGTAVKAGDEIATIDSAELEAQKRAAETTLASLRSQLAASRANEQVTKGSTVSDVANAEARLQSVQAQLTQAESDLERQSADTKRSLSLAQQGILSQQDRDHAAAALRSAQAQVKSLSEQARAAEADLQSAKARIHQTTAAESDVASMRAQMLTAQAQLEEAKTRLGYTRIIAPVSGTVYVRAAREGEVVTAGQPIVTIVDLSDSWVRVALPETYADHIQLGDTLPVRLPSGETLQGKVIFKATEADFATQRDVNRRKRDIKTVALKVRIDNPKMSYALGMTAEVVVPDSKLNGEGDGKTISLREQQ
jgi:multidrug resistance efflux pump